MMQRLLAYILAVLLAVLQMPMAAFAAENESAATVFSLEGSGAHENSDAAGQSETPSVPSSFAGTTIRVSGTAIQEALSRAGNTATASSPVTVVVPKGTYTISNLRIRSNTNLVLESGAVIKGTHLSVVLGAEGGANNGYNGPSNIKVSGGTWEALPNNIGIFKFNHCNNITFSNMTIKGGYLHAVNVSASNNVVFDKVTFKDTYAAPAGSGRSGIEELSECIHLDIANQATAEETGKDGTPPGKVVIRNCTFDNVHSCIGRHNVAVTKLNRSNATSVTITGCTFKNVKKRLVNAELLDNVVFSNNTLSGSVPEICIRTYDSKNLKISNNARLGYVDLRKTTGSIQNTHITGTKDNGIFVREGSNIAISNTKVTPTSGTGINVYNNATVTLKSVAITNAKNHGVKVNDNSKATIQDSSIMDTTGRGIQVDTKSSVNVLHSSITTTSQEGITIGGGSKLTFTNSSIASAGGHGIALLNAGACSISNSNIYKSKGIGILLNSTSNSTIDKNLVLDSSDHGILLDKNCTNVKVTNNTSNSNIDVKNKAEFLIKSACKNITLTGNKYGPRQFWIDTKSITTKNNKRYSYNALRSDEPEIVSQVWHRLWGQTQFDTMQKIVGDTYGWAKNSGGTVVLATSNGYWDALSAAGVAGLYNAPILITAKDKLSAQTRAELVRIKPTRVIIAGGPKAIYPAVENAVKSATGASVSRVYGQSATDTAAELAKKYFPKGKATNNTAILATSKGYWDALSASPVAYAKHYPIFLVEDKNTISKNTLAAMKACGIKNVIIAGGTSVVNAPVVNTLKKQGISVSERLWGQTLYDTSREIANWGIAHGMKADRMGVATSYGYYDALCGAALCGKNNAVLVLADGKNSQNTSVPKANKSSIARAYVFGGYKVVSVSTYNTCERSIR